MDIIRLTPPRKPDEELDVEQVPGPAPEPEVNQFAELKSAFIQALGTGKAADDDELMRELNAVPATFTRCSVSSPRTVLWSRTVPVVRLSESCNAVA